MRTRISRQNDVTQGRCLRGVILHSHHIPIDTKREDLYSPIETRSSIQNLEYNIIVRSLTIVINIIVSTVHLPSSWN